MSPSRSDPARSSDSQVSWVPAGPRSPASSSESIGGTRAGSGWGAPRGASWTQRPRVLILDEPTRGIDIGAKVEVHRIISELAASGLGIVLISSDLPEVLAMSDRILVMHEGRITAEVPHDRATEERVMYAATGSAG